MLPFSKKDYKFYACFVCGCHFKTFDEFKEHMTSKHDEGREFIKCPLCDAPIRDLNIHYRALHPRDTIPHGTQTKALIWRDFSTGKKKTKKPNFHGGQFVSIKNDGQLLNYRSGWELQAYECLEEISEVLKYEVESLKIPYYWSGKWHNYYPDLLVHFTDGRSEVWEIKPANQTDLEQNHAKWDACGKFCLAHGYKFIVQTEQGIHLLKMKKLNESKN